MSVFVYPPASHSFIEIHSSIKNQNLFFSRKEGTSTTVLVTCHMGTPGCGGAAVRYGDYEDRLA